eukprot:11775731-Alexandrium_andersonii.AAC.1
MAGKPENVKKGWSLIQSRLGLDPPTDIGRFLGCEHEIVERVHNGRVVRCMECRMAGFLEQRCDVFSEQFHVSIDELKV